MTYADAFNLRTTNVSFNSVADAIDGSFGRSWGGTTAGTSTAYTCTPSPAWTAYTAGDVITVIPHATSGASPTLNVNSLGAKSLRWRNVAVTSGMLYATYPATFVYDGTNFQLVNHSLIGIVLVNTLTQRNSGIVSVDYGGSSNAGIGINDTDSANGSGFISFLTGGTIRASITNNANTAVAYNTTSDHRLKEGIEDMGDDALEKILATRPREWTWAGTDIKGHGFVAHELAEVEPIAVSGVKDAVNAEGQPIYQGVDASFLIGRLVKSIQILDARIKVLEQGVA